MSTLGSVKFRVGIAALVVALGGAAACGGGDDERWLNVDDAPKTTVITDSPTTEPVKLIPAATTTSTPSTERQVP